MFATDLSCLELPAAQAVGLAVDPADGKLEGEACASDISLMEPLVIYQTDHYFEPILEIFLVYPCLAFDPSHSGVP